MYKVTWKLNRPNHQLGGASCGTRVFVYALIHVMCFCVYVSMVCQGCMLYDNMYSHDIMDIKVFAIFTFCGGDIKFFLWLVKNIYFMARLWETIVSN